MGDAIEASDNTSGDVIDGKSSNKTSTDKKRWLPLRFVRNLHRVGFSDSISTLDLSSLRAEVKKIDAVSPNAECQDCSTSPAESIEPTSDASEESAESETTESESRTSLASLVQLRGFFRLRKKGPGIPSPVLPPLIPKGMVKKGKRNGDDTVPPLDSTLDAELSCFKSSWKNFSLSELEEATDNFSPGKGGYAEVYKGQLKDGMYVAVKRLMKGSSEEMTIEFLSELGIMVHVDHPNIAKTIGYGVEGGLYLVLQLSHNGSLASILYGPREKLNWGLRFKIAVGTAEGLGYLHEGCQRRIIHKDIKAANILLSEHFDAQALVILKGDLSYLETLKERSAHRRTYSEEIFDAEEYNLTKCFD
ncbi:hypothetical protein V6N11_054615 [Hibiscus sabdariffa]|uniref:Protein kinase domain-containing protein n=1 Tax=Hibiscus sabdariffa TaxID=183260 RepID=A0ABR2S5A6_9ROSI